jgi:hypothetical protein
MAHLNERIADYVFKELPAAEMEQARHHLGQCLDCRAQVEQFQTTHALLQTSVDVDPPRKIFFEFEKPRAASWIWRWLAPMSASAAVAFAVVSFAPRPQPQIIERVVQQQPAAAAPMDYQKVIDELRAEDRLWLAGELNKRDEAHAKEIQRVRGEIAYLDAYQRAVERETWQNASSIQLLADRR